MTYFVQFRHPHFGWLGGRVDDPVPDHASIEGALAYAHRSYAYRQRVVCRDTGSVVATVSRDGKIERFTPTVPHA